MKGAYRLLPINLGRIFNYTVEFSTNLWYDFYSGAADMDYFGGIYLWQKYYVQWLVEYLRLFA